MTSLERQLLNAVRACASVLSGESMNKHSLTEALEMARDAMRHANEIHPNQVPSQHSKVSHERKNYPDRHAIT